MFNLFCILVMVRVGLRYGSGLERVAEGVVMIVLRRNSYAYFCFLVVLFDRILESLKDEFFYSYLGVEVKKNIDVVLCTVFKGVGFFF